MSESFFKFPSTPHMAILGDISVRDDKVMSGPERNEFLNNEIIVEEKVDGANLGISFDCSGSILVQNRGSFICEPYTGQWKKLPQWLTSRIDRFFDVLNERYILFGEWCYARHSLIYDNLPDWFLGFDIYDKKTQKFFSCERRDNLFRLFGINPVPFLGKGHFSMKNLKGFLCKSQLSDQFAEGIYMRIDNGDWLIQRAKLVRPEFLRTIGEHWSKKQIQLNRLG